MKTLQDLEDLLDQGAVFTLIEEELEYHIEAIEGGYLVYEDLEQTTFTALEPAVMYLLKRAGFFTTKEKEHE